MSAAGRTGRPVERVLSRLDRPRSSGRGWIARCPQHDDRHASLSVSEGEDGCALVHCHAGCATSDVVVRLGLAWPDLFPPRSRERRRPRHWLGTIPIGPHGRPALHCMDDDVTAAMLAETARVAHLRGTPDDRLGAWLARSQELLGLDRQRLHEAVDAALDGEGVS